MKINYKNTKPRTLNIQDVSPNRTLLWQNMKFKYEKSQTKIWNLNTKIVKQN
jgi:hypothetical protein